MDCLSLVNVGYGTFSEHMHTKSSLERIPLNGSFEVTMRCNVRCQHCYLPMSQRAGSGRDELSLDEIKRILDEVAEAGTLWLLLTGGEPFLRKDFLEIYNYTKRKGFITSIFTNGTLLTPAIADHLAEWRPFGIEISLYGATQETYEQVTGIPGSFARCLQGIELLLERNLPLQLKSVLMTLNQHEMTMMKEFSESLGLEFRFDPVINAGIDGDPHPTQFRLAPEKILVFEADDPGRSKNWPEAFEEYKNLEITSRQMYTCGAGRNTFHIDAYGNLSMCMTARTPSFDLRQGSFKQGWDGFMQNMLALEFSQKYACSSCELQLVCAQCPAMGLTEFGDPEARVPFICQLAHLRNDIFNLQVIQ